VAGFALMASRPGRRQTRARTEPVEADGPEARGCDRRAGSPSPRHQRRDSSAQSSAARGTAEGRRGGTASFLSAGRGRTPSRPAPRLGPEAVRTRPHQAFGKGRATIAVASPRCTETQGATRDVWWFRACRRPVPPTAGRSTRMSRPASATCPRRGRSPYGSSAADISHGPVSGNDRVVQCRDGSLGDPGPGQKGWRERRRQALECVIRASTKYTVIVHVPARIWSAQATSRGLARSRAGLAADTRDIPTVPRASGPATRVAGRHPGSVPRSATSPVSWIRR